MNLDDLPESLDPTQVVHAYEQAWREGHYRAFLELTFPQLWSELGVETREEFEAASADYRESSAGLLMVVTGVEIDGERATVTTTEASFDGSDRVVETVAHSLVRVEGSWEIAAVEATNA